MGWQIFIDENELCILIVLLLQLDFGFEVGVIYGGDDVIDEARQVQFLHEDLDPISYEWILELAEHKLDYLVSLREVRFRELESQKGPVFSSVEWDPPLKVDWAFDEAGVNLFVCVRSAHVDRRPRFKGYPIHPRFKEELESLPDRNIEELLSNCLFSRCLSFSSLCTLQ